MTKRHPDDPKPTWFRLSAESWAMIRTEYLSGATARTLAKKYRVSPTSIYRHACQEGWTKEAMAEAVSRKSVADAEREAAEAAAAAKQQHDEMTSLVERIAAEEDASDIAAAIERRALAQASAAMVQGRSKEAQALASMAEMMRKRVVKLPPVTPLVMQREAQMASPAELERRALAQAGEALARGDAAEAKALTAVAEQMRKRMEEAEAAARAEVERIEVDQAQKEEFYMQLFHHAAIVAAAMVHDPETAPGVFLRMIKRWREINLGESEADAEKRAAVIAAAQRRHIEGRERENLPEDVRAYVEARWMEARERLDRNEPVGLVKKLGEVVS
ncbi:MAG: hypothetical protein R3C27_01150 [Hyphomonadaceae bacterium]